MSVRALAKRAEKIGPPAFQYDAGHCPGNTTVLVSGDEITTAADLASIEATAPRCPLCGSVHVVVVEEVVVDDDGRELSPLALEAKT